MERVHSQRGFSLIEVLVSLFVLAVGLLGMAGLQATTQRATADSGNLGRAVRLAYDMSDRLRTERDAAQITNYINAAAADQTGSSSSGCYGASGSCTGATQVTAEVGDWQRLLALHLPNGQGIVCRDSAPYDTTPATCSGGVTDQLVVKVWWQTRDMQRLSATGTVTQQVVTFVGL